MFKKKTLSDYYSFTLMCISIKVLNANTNNYHINFVDKLNLYRLHFHNIVNTNVHVILKNPKISQKYERVKWAMIKMS